MFVDRPEIDMFVSGVNIPNIKEGWAGYYIFDDGYYAVSYLCESKEDIPIPLLGKLIGTWHIKPKSKPQ